MRFRTLTLSLFLLASLFSVALGAWADGAKIISVRDGEITLSNALGCKLAIDGEGGRYGLGSFYVNGVKMGGTLSTFLKEDNYYIWDDYKATRYEILENTTERGTIRFCGTVGGGERNQTSKWTANPPPQAQGGTIRAARYSLHHQQRQPALHIEVRSKRW